MIVFTFSLECNGNECELLANSCECLRMAYEHYECLTNALFIPSDLNVNIAFWSVECHNDMFLVMIHF